MLSVNLSVHYPEMVKNNICNNNILVCIIIAYQDIFEISGCYDSCKKMDISFKIRNEFVSKSCVMHISIVVYIFKQNYICVIIMIL